MLLVSHKIVLIKNGATLLGVTMQEPSKTAII